MKRGDNTKLLVHASVSSLATEPFTSPALPPWDVVIIREKDNPEGKDRNSVFRFSVFVRGVRGSMPASRAPCLPLLIQILPDFSLYGARMNNSPHRP